MINLNIIYTDQTVAPHIVYKNDMGEVWMGKSRNNNFTNIAMNCSSCIKMTPDDSIFIAEPICVLPQNYNIEFLSKFKYIFAWATKAFENSKIQNKVVYVNFPSYKRNPKINIPNLPSWEERKDEVVFIANNKSSPHPSELYSLRLKFADWLHANSKFNVSWYGNIPIKRSYYRGNVKNKQDILKRVKFHACMENSYDPVYSANFLTEKLPDAWLAGTVPIYMGCANMNELGISANCYIDMLSYRNDFNKLEQTLRSFNTEKYRQMTHAYSSLNNKLHSLTSYENVFDIMLKSYK